jgi:hypothetical protein
LVLAAAAAVAALQMTMTTYKQGSTASDDNHDLFPLKSLHRIFDIIFIW